MEAAHSISPCDQMRVKIFAGADIEHEESGDFCTLTAASARGGGSRKIGSRFEPCCDLPIGARAKFFACSQFGSWQV